MGKKQKHKSSKSATVSLNQVARQMFEQGLDLRGSGPDRPAKPYSQVTWVYICLNAIMDAAASIQMMISTDSDTIVESGEAYDLLFKSEQTFTNFLTNTIGFWRLFGVAYWVFDDIESNSITPKKISVVSPLQLRPIIHNGVLISYQLKKNNGQTIDYLIDEVYPVTSFNPYSSLAGVAATQPSELAISSSYQSSLYSEALFANGGRVGNVITMPGSVNDDQAEFLRSQFDARHGGSRNAGRTCLITNGADIKNIAQTLADMQACEQRNFDASEICASFGVPKEIANLASEAQYAHGPAQQRFIINTIAPMLSVLANHITIGILSRFKTKKTLSCKFSDCRTYPGRKSLPLNTKASYRKAFTKAISSGQNLFAWFAIEEHPTIQEMLQDKIDRVLKYTQSGVPLNDIIDSFDLPFEHTPWGSDWWIQMGLVPARFTLEEGLAASTGDSQPEGETDETDTGDTGDTDEAAKSVIDCKISKEELAIWRAFVSSTQPLEKEFSRKLNSYFGRQKRETVERLKKAMPDEKTIKSPDDIIMNVIFDLKTENKKLVAINKVQFLRDCELGIRQSVTEVTDLSGAKLNARAAGILAEPQARAAMVISGENIKNANTVTKRWITAQLKEGLLNGEGLSDLVKRITSDRSFTIARAKRIARTQVSGAVSAGRQAGYEKSGIELKSWITSGDDHVRSSHRQAAQDSKDGIAINTPYQVGTCSLMYPADPSGTAAEIANCRCVSIAKAAKPQVANGKQFGVKFYTGRKFYDLTDLQRDKSCQ